MTSDRTARRDATFAIAMIAAGALTIWGVRNQPRAPIDPVGAAAIPFWTAIAVIALASILLARIILGHRVQVEAVVVLHEEPVRLGEGARVRVLCEYSQWENSCY